MMMNPELQYRLIQARVGELQAEAAASAMARQAQRAGKQAQAPVTLVARARRHGAMRPVKALLSAARHRPLAA